MNGPVNALELCNACDVNPMHDGCRPGYCTEGCPHHTDRRTEPR